MFFLLIASFFSLGSTYQGDPITKDGIATIIGYSGTTYQAVRYIPVCGTLGPTSTAPISVTSQCDPAMSVFNTTSAIFSFFDITGVLLSINPVTGTAGCMCFSLAMLSGTQGDFCIYIDGYGQTEVYYQSLEYIVQGDFQPGGKSLPQCKDVNISSISSSIYATATGTNPTPTTDSNGSPVTGSPSSPSTTNTSTSTNPSTSSSDGLTRPAEIGTIVAAITGAILLAIAVWQCFCRQKPH